MRSTICAVDIRVWHGETNMLTHELLPRRGKVRVTFSIPGSIWADTIHLVGDFNNWNQRSCPLIQNEEHWTITLELEAGREYRYRYLFNQTDWHPDSNAGKSMPNPYGGFDSVVVT